MQSRLSTPGPPDRHDRHDGVTGLVNGFIHDLLSSSSVVMASFKRDMDGDTCPSN